MIELQNGGRVHVALATVRELAAALVRAISKGDDAERRFLLDELGRRVGPPW